MSLVVGGIFLGTCTFFLLVGLAFGFGDPRSNIKKRARGLRERGTKKRKTPNALSPDVQNVRHSTGRSLPVLEVLAKRYLPRQSELRNRLLRAGFETTIGTYAGVSAGVGVAGCLVLILVAHLPLMAALVGGFAIGVGLPHIFVGFMGKRRRTKFMALLPDAMDLLVRGLKSGLPVTESMASAGREMADPLGKEFRAITDAVRMGRGLEEVLWETAKRLDTEEFNFFVVSLSIQRETGGNLAETLANLSDILRKRKQMRLKIKALSSEARMSAYILGALPFVMFGIIHTVNPEYAMLLYTDLRGQFLLAGAGAVLTIGFAVMAKMIRFEI